MSDRESQNQRISDLSAISTTQAKKRPPPHLEIFKCDGVHLNPSWKSPAKTLEPPSQPAIPGLSHQAITTLEIALRTLKTTKTPSQKLQSVSTRPTSKTPDFGAKPQNLDLSKVEIGGMQTSDFLAGEKSLENSER